MAWVFFDWAFGCFSVGILPRRTESPECLTAPPLAIFWREMSMNL